MEQVVLIPLTLTILPKPRNNEVRLEVGYRAGQDMEIGIEEEGKGANWAELHLLMVQGTILDCVACLFVLSIVSQGHKHLQAAVGNKE